ncbi:cytochrome P450, variant 2 [Coprinopsis cinerea AmutBmut pab1-1]|nr:cytochrome P450, variant 2 [Coprinopsis cinerea AmutBmut pab1-1]
MVNISMKPFQLKYRNPGDGLRYEMTYLSFPHWGLPSLSLHSGFVALAGSVLAVIFLVLFRRRAPTLPLPPGPKRLPIIGSLFHIPSKTPWVAYNELSKKYGDLIYFEAMGRPILILNSLSAVQDLLEKRSANYSDRATNPAFQLMKLEWMMGLMDYGPWWKSHRRPLQQQFSPRELARYRPILQQEVSAFLLKLTENPKSFLDTTHLFFGSVIMRISYGVNDFNYNKSFIMQAEALLDMIAHATAPGHFLVNVFPLLRHVPAWFPGAGWKRRLQEAVQIGLNLRVGAFEGAKQRVQLGQREYPCVAHRMLDSLPPEDDPQYGAQAAIATNVAAMTYVAGADTMVSSGKVLFLALANNPDVQRRGQEEIDTVIGPGRLPTPGDLQKLPYVQAIVMELTRWYTVAPLGLLHAATEDDEYHGYFIPKGTFIFPNSWAILHDPNVFDDPFAFKPERYLKNGTINPDVLDPEVAAFGYGRRICPGRHLSNEIIGYLTACLLFAFNISPPKDRDGNALPLNLEVTSEMLS